MSADKDFQNLTPLQQAYFLLDEAESKLEKIQRARSEPIAIIGMACRFPGGANTPDAYWQLLEKGFDGISEIPKSRWNVDQYYDPNPDAPGKMYTRLGGFLNVPVDQFDPQFFGISPREAEFMDPQQRLLLEVSWEALENAGINPKSLAGSNTGVFIATSTADYKDLFFANASADQIESFFSTGVSSSVLAGRLSYFYGLQGPSFSLDTACSSSLVALHEACQKLHAGEIDLALVGGINLILSPYIHISLCKANMLAPDGYCKTFDASANGYSRGEGCGMVLLKHLNDAIQDKDRILAVIKSSSNNQDGSSSGLTVPNGEAQIALIRKALQQAKLEANAVDYIETHGTGTALGDPIEVGALTAVFSGAREKPLLLGTVKTNIGHLESAAGVAGLIKTILSLQHEAIPPPDPFSKT